MDTRFTRLLGITAPIICSPMSGSTGGTIAAAVSNAGGLGTFGAHNRGGPEWLRDQIRLAKSLTDNPFGVGFIVRDNGIREEVFSITLEEEVPVLHFSFADASPYLKRAKDAGVTVISQVQSERSAKAAVDAGADVLVAQGNEAGGHSGEAALMPLFERVRELYPNMPVLTAGGISSKRSFDAVMNAGADGASVGTAFLACSDNPDVDERYQQRIIEGSGTQTVRTDLFDRLTEASGMPPWPAGIAARVLSNRMVEQWAGREEEMSRQIDSVLPVYREGSAIGNPDTRALFAGLGTGDITSVRSAAEIIADICATE